MKQRIEQILAEINELKCKTQKEVEEARVRLLGKKGEITRLFEEFRTMDKELKKEFGRSLNELKQAAQNKIEEYKNSIGEDTSAAGPKEDLTISSSAPKNADEPAKVVLYANGMEIYGEKIVVAYAPADFPDL